MQAGGARDTPLSTHKKNSILDTLFKLFWLYMCIDSLELYWDEKQLNY